MSVRLDRRTRVWPVFLAALVAGLAMCATTVAQEHTGSASESHEHSHHKNAFGGFIGFTGEDNRAGSGRERALTFGLEYERRFSEKFGVLFAAERAFGDLDFTVITVPLVYREGPWAFSFGPGIEIPDHKEDNEFVFRVAGTYIFDRGTYEVAPKAGLDFVAGEVVFFAGFVVGYGF
jgi:hypothetical protein